MEEEVLWKHLTAGIPISEPQAGTGLWPAREPGCTAGGEWLVSK